MLINLSNHSVATWSSEQIQKAKAFYDEIKDYVFPIIKPEASSDVVKTMAENTVDDIIKRYGKNITVHIMGELCFVYAAVGYLQDAGVACVASTSRRRAEILPNGDKISSFHFVTFREYATFQKRLL